MRNPLFAIAFAICAFSAAFAFDQPTPKPIPPDKQEALSRVLLDAKDAQIELMQSPAWSKLQDANARLEKLLGALEKDYGAPGCKLTKEKTWECPKPAEEKKPAKD